MLGIFLTNIVFKTLQKTIMILSTCSPEPSTSEIGTFSKVRSLKQHATVQNSIPKYYAFIGIIFLLINRILPFTLVPRQIDCIEVRNSTYYTVIIVFISSVVGTPNNIQLYSSQKRRNTECVCVCPLYYMCRGQMRPFRPRTIILYYYKGLPVSAVSARKQYTCGIYHVQ